MADKIVYALCLLCVVGGMGVSLDPREGGGGLLEEAAAGVVEAVVESVNNFRDVEDARPPHLQSNTMTTSVGNLVYSVVGFTLGGLLLLVSLFDPARKEVVDFFDHLFGSKEKGRRRAATDGDVGTAGLEDKVSEVFNAFTAAVDKMDLISRMAKK